MGVKVSIVMSCYNAENTIEKAIQSVLNNTYKNIELIIIDDCSTDNSLKIISKQRDSRIKVIKHKRNLGAGVSRKDGIKVATGDYIGFCDSDDILLEKHIENLVNAAVENDADIATSGYTIIEGNTGETKEERKADKLYILEGDNKYTKLKADILRFLNPSIVRKSLWKKVSYSTRRYVEDSPTLIKLLWYANKRVIISDSTYMYYQWKTSLTHHKSPFKTSIYEMLCYKDTYEFFAKTLNKPKYTPHNLMVIKLANYLGNLPTEEDKIQFATEIKEMKQFILEYYEKTFE